MNEKLTTLRDLLYNNNPEIIINTPGFTFNRDEFVFTFSDNITKIVSVSDIKFYIRIGKSNIIEIIDNEGDWTIIKFDNTVLTITDTEIEWLSLKIDELIININYYLDINHNENEYQNFLNRINNNEL